MTNAALPSRRITSRRQLIGLHVLVLIAAVGSALHGIGSSPRGREVSPAALASETSPIARLRGHLVVGIATMDTSGRWCAAFPAATRPAPGASVALVIGESSAHVAALRARLGVRRDAPCWSAFPQPRWAEYQAYDVMLRDSAGPDAPSGNGVALAVVSPAAWSLGADGVARADLDGDGVAEEVRRCRADEGEHLVLWSTRQNGTRHQLAHEYFDWGAEVEPTCTVADTAG